MFEEINKIKIKIIYKETEDLKPNALNVESLKILFDATEWLFDEFIKDCQDTKRRIDNRYIKKEMHYIEDNLKDREKKDIRTMSRTLGYVNQLCLMEDLLTYEYNKIYKLVSKKFDKNKRNNLLEKYEILKERFEPIRSFRNKVSAHQAHVKPSPRDSKETLIDSAFSLYVKGDSLGVGWNPFFKTYKSEIPIITIFDWEEKVKPIFQDWDSLLMEILKETHRNCPIDNDLYIVKIANPRKARELKD